MKRLIVFPLLLFIAALLIYFVKLSPTVYSGDSGDLITAAYFLGVPHPPGYPLYTALGHLFTLIPLNSVAWRVNLMSAFFQAATIPIVFLIIYNLTKGVASKGPVLASRIIPAVFGATLLAVSFTFWFYSEIAEVFSLNNFLAAQIILLAVLFRQTKKTIFVYLLTFLLSFSLVHHQIIILIYPAVLILILNPLKALIKVKGYKQIAKLILTFILGFLPLLYFPAIANSASPVFWDEPNTLTNFFRLITRADYGTFQSSRIYIEPLEGRIVHFAAFVRIFLVDFTILGLILTVLGIIASFVKDKVLGLSLLAGFLIPGPLFLIYANFPQGDAFEISVIERFTILSGIFVVILASLGVFYFGEFLAKLLKNLSPAAKNFKFLIPLVFLLLPAVSFLENWQKIDLSKNYLGKTLAKDILSSLPEGALVLLRGDTIVFNTQYVHFVEGFRPDLKVVSVGVLITDWFYNNQVKRIYPEFLVPQVPTSERLSSFVAANFERLPTFQFGPQFSVPGFTLVPFGLGAKLYKNDQLPQTDEIFHQNLQLWQSFKIPQKSGFSDVLFDFSRKIYTEAVFRTANFFFDQGNFEKALVFYKKSLEVDSAYWPARQMSGKIFAKLGNCQSAKAEFEQILKLLPTEPGVNQDLSELFKNCFGDENLATIFEKRAKEARVKSLKLLPLSEY